MQGQIKKQDLTNKKQKIDRSRATQPQNRRITDPRVSLTHKGEKIINRNP